MIDCEQETLIPFREAVKLLPHREGKPPHISLLYRWSSVGLRGIRLEFVQAGGTRCTSHAAVARFFNSLTEVEYPASVSTTPSQRRRQIEAAERKLEREGF